MDHTHLKYVVNDRVAYITLDRPREKNAFNATLVKELSEALAAAEKSAEIRIIVLKSEGDVFSSGTDPSYLNEISGYSFDRNLNDSKALMRLFMQIYRSKKPVIAEVKGSAAGNGFTLAIVSDLIIATKDAVFGFPEARHGLTAALGIVFLVRRIGEGRARDILLTGRPVTADEALNTGIINRIVSAGEIEDHIESLCGSMKNNISGSAIAITKEILSKLPGVDIQDALEFACRMNAAGIMSNDSKRGIEAVLKGSEIKW